jgi:hypothetical protein
MSISNKLGNRDSRVSVDSSYHVQSDMEIHPDSQTWPEPVGNLKLKHKDGTEGGDMTGFTMVVGHADMLGDGAYGKVRTVGGWCCWTRQGPGGWSCGWMQGVAGEGCAPSLDVCPLPTSLTTHTHTHTHTHTPGLPRCAHPVWTQRCGQGGHHGWYGQCTCPPPAVYCVSD